jgi:hypothetical protein
LKYGGTPIYGLNLPLVPDLATVNIEFGSLPIQAGDIDYGWTYSSARQQIIFGSKINWSTQPTGTKLVVTYVPLEWQK